LTEVLSGNTDKNIKKAVKALKSGKLVAFPTETVYGLGADYNNLDAVKKIFAAKSRPLFDPLILHVAHKEQVKQICVDIPIISDVLAERFWPGPLTMVFKKAAAVSSLVSANLNTVAVRNPKHQVALKLLEASGCIIAAPSANKFQGMSPTTAEAVVSELNGEVDIVLDGGPCDIGIESTILDLSEVNEKSKITLLRWGGLSMEDILELKELSPYKFEVARSRHFEKILAPGMLEFHYAPKKPIEVFTFENVKALSKYEITHYSWLCFSQTERDFLMQNSVNNIHVLSLTGDLKEAARNYFSQLRKMDEDDSPRLAAIEVPNEQLGRAINDRLKKAKH
jgi:L-threonylcarbamoyladenylate synthase